MPSIKSPSMPKGKQPQMDTDMRPPSPIRQPKRGDTHQTTKPKDKTKPSKKAN